MSEGWNRLKGLDPKDWSEEVRSSLAATMGPVSALVGAKPGEKAPDTLNILLQIAHHGKALGPFLGFASAMALHGKLSRRDHELAALRAIWHCQSDFEWGHHVAFAKTAGLNDAEIARIPVGPADPAWSAADRELLEATDELCARQTIGDATWKKLHARLSDTELVELPMIVGVYTMLSMVANATGVPLEPGFPSLPKSRPVAMPIHGVHHVAMSVPDLDRAHAFYVGVLGFEEIFRDGWRDAPHVDRVMGVTGGAGRAMLLSAGNLYLELFEFEKPVPAPHDPAPAVHRYGFTHIALDVTDIEAIHRRLVEAGMTFHCVPESSYGVRTTYGRDPFGNLIELQQIDEDGLMPRLGGRRSGKTTA